MLNRVLIVGSGITAAVTASLLRKILPHACSLSIWDKAKGPGGRMATSRSPSDEKCTLDLGLQYISPTSQEYKTHKSFYDDLVTHGLLSPMRGIVEGEDPYADDATHFVAPAGSCSLVKHFLKSAGTEANFNHHIDKIELCENKTWYVSTIGGQSAEFDCVLLTMPVPQLLQLNGSLTSLLQSQPTVDARLRSVSFSTRFALGLFFAPGVTVDVPWSVKYVAGDSVIRYIAIDNKKRDMVAAEVGWSLVVHTTVPFGLENINEDKDKICEEVVLPRLKKLLPQLPTPVLVKKHLWKFSQVHNAYDGRPGAVVLHTDPMLVVGGDSFTYSKLDGCINSAETMVRLISAQL